jgi:hypothetical protein
MVLRCGVCEDVARFWRGFESDGRWRSALVIRIVILTGFSGVFSVVDGHGRPRITGLWLATNDATIRVEAKVRGGRGRETDTLHMFVRGQLHGHFFFLSRTLATRTLVCELHGRLYTSYYSELMGRWRSMVGRWVLQKLVINSTA